MRVRFRSAGANNLVNRFYQYKIPESGTGACHTGILGAANLGIMAGLDTNSIFREIRGKIIEGRRRVSDQEILDAIDRASRDHSGRAPGAVDSRLLHSRKPARDNRALYRMIGQGAGVDEYEIWERSPVRIQWGEPGPFDVLAVLKYLYSPDDLLYMGDAFGMGAIGKTIRSAGEWFDYISDRGIPKGAEYIIPNPLTGTQGETKKGTASFRADSCVKHPMIAVIEFDGLSFGDQCQFWGGCPLPVYALIYSGGKSIHGWVKTGCQTAQEWEARIENRLFRELLDPMVLASGAQAIDKSCKNEARLSRIPGAFRRDKNKVQRLLYLAPEGKPVMR